ncbi:hypothetical protein TMatcc_002538 [Talaromyces marneffei ATCC 18224]
MKTSATTGRGQQTVSRSQDNHKETEWSNIPVKFQGTEFDSAPNDLLFYDFSDLGIWNNDLQWQDGDEKTEELSTLNGWLDRASAVNISASNTNPRNGLLIPSLETHLLPSVPNLGSIFNLPDFLSSLYADHYNPPNAHGVSLSCFTHFPLNEGMDGAGHSSLLSPDFLENPDRETLSSKKPNATDDDGSEVTDDENRTYSYEYIPLSINDWTVPVDAVYRPHGVHARKVSNVEKSITKKRYFLSVR